MALGDQIRKARLRLGFSRRAVGEKFGISRAAVAQWENGTTRPDQGKLVELAGFLGISLDGLLSDGSGRSGVAEPPPDRDLLEAWEYLLPSEREPLLAKIKQLAAHNREAAAHFKPKVVRVTDKRERRVHFEGPDHRQRKEDSDA